MASSLDVAQYILEKMGPLTTIKLQKLVYYSQAWALVWDDEPIFDDEIQAWANGPVAPRLFFKHQGQYRIDSIPEGDSSRLKDYHKETIDVVIRDYGNKNSQWLVELSHLEDPWKMARRGCPDGAPCSEIITHASMAEYYSGLK
ncbi:Panacea domain-containing protein [Solidesulfovibrio alcoholivorans]|uniref:Panacea domain-containing protein n=1 Tax=Solidesulfovibrio alcoholivorans TaxID=81406 RepID=UPI0009FEAC9D|nr:type II toxin-antitoxin system antitoxin SocA domain-containing protein [Solidesulfovibrio alcoholivorans]